ncbi:MAG: zinc ABC transporter substrate-binding protein [Alphaproteobacteria bacterium]|nr:zinc ABC transporter substrate-binding protein [Alphaproteobacteria bacterium]
MRRALPILLFLLAPLPVAASAPPVVATIKPLHSLVALVMEGVGEPRLLIAAGSPHGYSLKPSEARALSEAQVVFRVSDQLETFLDKPLKNLAGRAVVVEMAEAPGVQLLPPREGGLWETHADEHGERHDTHLWLDPANALAFLDAAAAALERVDPPNAATYRANAGAAKRRIAALDAEIAARLAPLAKRPFLVFHDAYQYFERRYGLAAAGSVTIDPERSPGAKRIVALRERLARHDVACVFREPQFSPKAIATIVEGTAVAVGELDDLGTALPPGPHHYEATLRAMADSVAACLGARP